MPAQDYVKMILVRLVQEELAGENPDAVDVANWLERTAPPFGIAIASATEDQIFLFMQTDAFLKHLGDAEDVKKFVLAMREELIAILKRRQAASAAA